MAYSAARPRLARNFDGIRSVSRVPLPSSRVSFNENKQFNEGRAEVVWNWDEDVRPQPNSSTVKGTLESGELNPYV